MENQNKQEDKLVTVKLHRSEANLIQRIRDKYNYGEITIEIYDGLPSRIVVEKHYDKIWVR